MYYDKIDTLFTRGEDHKVDVGNYRRPEFTIPKLWDVTEKIHGTSVFLWFCRGGYGFGGRTSKTTFSPAHATFLDNLSSHVDDQAQVVMDDFGLSDLNVYGELYGPGIQSGGRYASELQFAVFDMLANNKWLSGAEMLDNVAAMRLQSVPIVGKMPADDIYSLVKRGFKSKIAVDSTYEAEGIVAKAPVTLRNNGGRRLMFKLKTKDF